MTESTVTAVTSPLDLFRQADEKTEAARQAQADVLLTSSESTRLYREAEELRKQAKWAIQDGATTGDRALDFAVVLDGGPFKAVNTESVSYIRIKRLLTAAKRYRGQPMVYYGRISSGWQVAMIRSDGLAGFGHTWIGDPTITVSSGLLGSARVGSDGSVHRSVEAKDLCFSMSDFNYYFDDKRRRQNMHMGRRQVRDWFDKLPTEERFAAWVLLREIGCPLEADAELASDIQRRREEMVEKLVQAEIKLADLRFELRKWQSDPIGFLSSRPSYNSLRDFVKPTDDGVAIDFKMSDRISGAQLALAGLLKTAEVELLMTDNSIWQRIAKTQPKPSSADA